jgi:hypothetical protein
MSVNGQGTAAESYTNDNPRRFPSDPWQRLELTPCRWYPTAVYINNIPGSFYDEPAFIAVQPNAFDLFSQFLRLQQSKFLRAVVLFKQAGRDAVNLFISTLRGQNSRYQ